MMAMVMIYFKPFANVSTSHGFNWILISTLGSRTHGKKLYPHFTEQLIKVQEIRQHAQNTGHL